VPVVREGTLLGIVTRIDLLKHPEEEQIAMLMTRDPITIVPDAPLSKAAAILMQTGLRRLPVVVRGKLVGIVTVSDIVGAIGQMDIKEPIKTFVRDGIVAVWDETPVPVASEIIRLSKRDALPVLNTKRELAGIISITDIINLSRIEDTVEKSDMSAGADEDKWTWESMRDTMSLYYGVSRISLPDVAVKTVMIKDVITAYHKTAVSECARKMRRNRIEQVPVITADNKLDGLLLDRELLAVIAEKLPAQPPKTV
jgi:CBS domain-containing protein